MDAALEPDMPEPSDFCNKIRPVIKTATMISNTSNTENIFIPLVCYLCYDCSHPDLKLQGFLANFLPHLILPIFWMRQRLLLIYQAQSLLL